MKISSSILLVISSFMLLSIIVQAQNNKMELSPTIGFVINHEDLGYLIENFSITTETETSCFAFTPIPQLIDKINISSSNAVESN